MRIHTGPVLYSSFNQDFSCLAIGTRTGFRVFNCDPFGRSLVKNDGGIGIIEMLFTTSLIALVGAGEQPTHSPRKLQIMNTKKQSIICELSFASAVLAVHLNRRRLAVVLESSIQLYDIANMKLLYTVDLNYNPNLVTAMSPASDMCYLAYPTPVPVPPAGLAGASTSLSGNSGSISAASNPAATSSASPSTPSSSSHAIGGDITLFDAISLHPTTIISAHKSPLAALAFSSSGRYLATASSKGTLIRVFGVPDGAPMYQFRRGTYPTRIYSLAFHPDESLLAVSSATETVHVFRLTAGGTHLQTQQQMMSAGGGGGSGVASPDWVSETASIGSSVATYPPPVPGGASAASDGSTPGGAGGPPLLSSLVGSASSAVSSLWSKRSALHAYLPEAFVKSVLDPTRDIVRARVPTGVGERSVVGFAGGSHLMVVTAEGYLHVYAMDVAGAVSGGGQGVDECVMVRQYRLLDDVAAS